MESDMIKRDELTGYLAGLYDYAAFDDYCENGLQVEGKDQIKTIVFGVSFNMPLLKRAVELNADAIIVHHGVFQPGLFRIRDALKRKIKLLMDHDISLYGIHLPMDAHPEAGHNALLLSFLDAANTQPFDVGFMGDNVKKHSFDNILEIFHRRLHPEHSNINSSEGYESKYFSLSRKHGFTVVQNGPDVPAKIAIISGGASRHYEDLAALGVDTFVVGEIKEHIPAVSLDTHTNFVNLGHYFSEKPGVLELQKRIQDAFDVKTEYIEIVNPV